MYEKSPAKVRVDLSASLALTIALVLVHGGALAIAQFVPISPWLRVAIGLFIVFSLYRGVMRHAWRRARDAVVAFELEPEDDRCALLDASGDWKSGRLVDRWVHPLLALLIVKLDGRRGKASVVIPADATAAEPFRRLRVRLQWQRPAA